MKICFKVVSLFWACFFFLSNDVLPMKNSAVAAKPVTPAARKHREEKVAAASKFSLDMIEDDIIKEFTYDAYRDDSEEENFKNAIDTHPAKYGFLRHNLFEFFHLCYHGIDSCGYSVLVPSDKKMLLVELLDILWQCGSDFGVLDEKSGDSLLHVMARYFDVTSVEFLLKKIELNPNVVNKEGETVLDAILYRMVYFIRCRDPIFGSGSYLLGRCKNTIDILIKYGVKLKKMKEEKDWLPILKKKYEEIEEELVCTKSYIQEWKNDSAFPFTKGVFLCPAICQRDYEKAYCENLSSKKQIVQIIDMLKNLVIVNPKNP